jgi:LysM domain-containing protein/D-alanyl-D-alanine carboxypeptidase-like protein/putative peptidoglycan binding protein
MNALRRMPFLLFLFVVLSGAEGLSREHDGLSGALRQRKAQHEVSAGETLYGLARRYGTTVAELRRLNGIRGDMIFPGQRLEIPQASPRVTPSPRSTSSPIATRDSPSSDTPPPAPIRDQGPAAVIAAQVDAAIGSGLASAKTSPLRALALLRGAVFRSGFKNAKARYFLAKHYDQLAVHERDPGRAREYRRNALLHYQGAQDSARGEFVANARWAREAKARIADRDPLELSVRAGRGVGAGDRGPAVESLQARLGVTRDGVFGPRTEAALKSIQRGLSLPASGVADSNTVAALDQRRSLATGPGTSTFDAYRHGVRLGPIGVVTIDGKPVAEATARAFIRMRDAAAQDGVQLRVVSGFRSNPHQAKLYRLYLQGRGNLAARPGYSNHQSGGALDLNTAAPGALRWLNAYGARYRFYRTVPSEDWHWEFLP